MTQLLVLGLLKKEALSGYDIQLKLQTAHEELWGDILVGSIYYALNKLERDGYIEVSFLKQTGRRQKSIYSITDKGEKYLDKLVLTSLETADFSYSTTLYSALNFFELLPKEAYIPALEKHKKSLEENFEILHRQKIRKEKFFEGNMPPLTDLIFENMFNTLKEQISFVEKVIELLK